MPKDSSIRTSLIIEILFYCIPLVLGTLRPSTRLISTQVLSQFAALSAGSLQSIYSMRQKFSNCFNPKNFMVKHAKVFDMCFIGRV